MADYNLQFTGQQVQGILEEGDRLHAQVTLNETAIADIRKRLDGYLLKSDYLQSEQNINRGILENSEAISDNTAAIAQNQQGIAQNVTSIGKLTDALNALRVQLHELEWQKVEAYESESSPNRYFFFEANKFRWLRLVKLNSMNQDGYGPFSVEIDLDMLVRAYNPDKTNLWKLTAYIGGAFAQLFYVTIAGADGVPEYIAVENNVPYDEVGVYVRGISANASTVTTTTKADADTNTVVVSNSDGTGQVYSIAEDGKTALSGSYVKVDDVIYVNGKVSTDDTLNALITRS